MNKLQELEAARNLEPDCDYGAVGAGRYTRAGKPPDLQADDHAGYPASDTARGDIDRTHAVLDRADVPRTGVDKQLTLEQRVTILLHWYQRGTGRR